MEDKNMAFIKNNEFVLPNNNWESSSVPTHGEFNRIESNIAWLEERIAALEDLTGYLDI